MRKLMFYINTIHHGGAERVMTLLTGALAERGYDCTLITSFPDEQWEYPLSSKVRRINLEEKEIDDGFLKKNFRRTKRLRELCAKEKPDYLISFMPQPILRSLMATIGTPVRNIISIRNDPSLYWKNKIENVLATLLLKRTDWAVFQTPNARDYYRDTDLYNKSSVILNPVDLPFYKIEPNHEAKTVVSCGRLVEQKNYALLIEAFEKISSKFPDWKLLIYGVGPLELKLLTLINSLDMHDKIFLMGASDNIPKVLSESSIFVLSSDYEGLPNALMEALASGVPSISTMCPCGGPEYLINTGENGLLIPVGNREKLCGALELLIENEEKRVLISKNAKLMAKEYELNSIISKWERIFAELEAG